MYLALPRDHPLAHKPRVRLADVADETWIQEGDPRSWCGALPRRRPARRPGSSPKVGFRSDDYNVVQGLIAAGVGISLLPGLALDEHARGHRDPLARQAGARRAGSPRPRSPAATARPPPSAMLEILGEVAARFELPSGAAVAA